MPKTKYNALKIIGYDSGLVQEREDFLLPDDAYPTLLNAYLFREKIKRKRGTQFLGRLRRDLTSFVAPNPDGTATYSQDILSSLRSVEPDAEMQPGSLTLYLDQGLGNETIYEDDGLGGIIYVSGPFTISSGSIVYASGVVTLNFTSIPGAGVPVTADLGYFPTLPSMGIENQEKTAANDRTIFFDQRYAYEFNAATNLFEEYLPLTGVTWNAHNGNVAAADFFWSTNYWVSGGASSPFGSTNQKLFWVTNNTGQYFASQDPPRITDGVTWVDFFPSTWSQIDSGPNYLTNFLCMVPFRGRMVTFNTWEGSSSAAQQNYFNRIRWSTIGNPFIPYAVGPPSTGSWRDDIRGQGGFLDIPTSENITGIGFVRDNLVVFTETQTWQLRYTGRSIQPFQIEKVNTELGSDGVKAPIQFDTAVFGFGSRGITQCDSYKADRIDFKIPNFVFQVQSKNSGPKRTQGIRDYINQLAYWTFAYAGADFPIAGDGIFPTLRLIYNYESKSWAIFQDSLTTLGIYRPQSSRTWLNTKLPWIRCNFNWIDRPSEVPSIVGGNQQGYISYLDETTANDPTLSIQDIIGNTTTPTVVNSPVHNLVTGNVIKIVGILAGTPFESLNDQVFGVNVLSSETFELYKYDPVTDQFSDPQIDDPATYVGGGEIRVRDNFSVTSKKFNYLDEGFSIQLGFIDILMVATERNDPGAISLNIYLNYDEDTVYNQTPENAVNDGSAAPPPDTFFNTTIPTTQSSLSGIEGSKFWQRVFCPVRSNFITIEYTFSNSQMAGEEFEKDVQIDGQVLWIRRAGTLSQI